MFDIQSWWEVPSIAHFCSLFRAAFNLLDFDIEELEEALLTDGTEECASSLLTELIVRLLRGCLGNNDISASNYQMFLRRLFRQKCQETGHSNIFNADIDFQFLPLRRKVQILQALCDFRLAADDVFDLLKNLEAESLRVEPLGWDDNASAYFYFYGTRLYREDYILKSKGKKRKKDDKRSRKYGDIPEIEEKTERVWQVVCFTEADWIHLTEKFKDSTSRVEKDLYLSLSENFLPEIPRLFQEKERLRRKRLLESMPRRTSSRVQTKKQREEEEMKQVEGDFKEFHRGEMEVTERGHRREMEIAEREHRARQRELKRSQSYSSRSEKSLSPTRENSSKDTPPKQKKKSGRKHSRQVENFNSGSTEGTTQAKPSGRQTNNSLACATGQILIPDPKEKPHNARKKLKGSQMLGLMEEDVQTDMYKVLKHLKAHEDAWPFLDPVEEDYAPNYYSVIRRPMDLQRMEDRLDQGYYTDFTMFQSDFNLIIKNCRLYNGQNNEYTEMADNLETVFNKLTQHLYDSYTSSDEDVAVEFPVRNLKKHSSRSEKHKKDGHESKKRKRESSCDYIDDEDMDVGKKYKERKSGISSDSTLDRSSKNDIFDEDNLDNEEGKLSSSHTKSKSDDSEKCKRVSSKKKKKKTKELKESKKKHKDKRISKKNKEKRKHSKHQNKKLKKKKIRRSSVESIEMKNEKYSANETGEPIMSNQTESSGEVLFYKDKYDKIKERHRTATKLYNENFSEANKLQDKNKPKTNILEKNKNPKLKETIEKLKAKSEKSNSESVFEDYFGNSQEKIKKKYSTDELFKPAYSNKNKTDEYEFVDDLDSSDEKKNSSQKQNQKKLKNKLTVNQSSNTKNESASEALEQAVKDISKWLGDTPKLSEFSSNSNSPSQVSDEYTVVGSKVEDDISNQVDKDKNLNSKKDSTRKKLVNKDITAKVNVSRKKEIQRTIERLQPGKTKGNLISNVQSLLKQEDIVTHSNILKSKDNKTSSITKTEDVDSPKLSLGTVLDTVGFGIEGQHNFTNEASSDRANKVKVVDTGTMTCDSEEKLPSDNIIVKTSTDEIPKIEEDTKEKKEIIMAPSQEKATPNLSAWFKAFGTPKSGNKKKTDEVEQDDSKSNDIQFDAKNLSTNNSKTEQVTTDETINSEGGESPLPNLMVGGRQRRTSTGSSISERSSFSQDLDSPRHQPSHPSPLLRSPASPRIEDHQKNLYPPLNGTVRVGFYQDTASVKSSPEKSCSPREAPQSPYATYSQHVYAVSSNTAHMSSQMSTNYNDGSSKSPLPPYAHSYYDSTRNYTNKSTHTPDEYPENLYKPPASPIARPFSPAHSAYSQHSQHSPYSHPQNSPQAFTQYSSTNAPLQNFDAKPPDKSSIFPVKKRSYNGTMQLSDNSNTSAISMKVVSNCDGNKNEDKHIPIRSNPTFDSNKDVHIVNSSFPASVIMSSSVNNSQKLPYSNCQIISNESPVPSNLDSPKVSSESQVKTKSKEQTYMRDPYTDISSIQHSITRKQYDFSPISSLNKVYSDNITDIPKQSTLDLKNISYANNMDLMSNKSDSTNIDYSNKNESQSKSNSDLSLGYLPSDNVSPPKLDPLNTLLNKTHRTSELYSIPYTSIMDLNSNQNVSKTSIDSVESVSRYTMEKLNQNPQYQNLSLDAMKNITSSVTSDNLKKLRADILPRVSYSEEHGLNLKEQNIPDWKSDSVNKSSDAYSGYHTVNESNRTCLPDIPSKTVPQTVTPTNIVDSNESYMKAQAELRVPMCGVSDISSHKTENQPMSQSDFNSRTKNHMSLHTSSKSIDTIFSHNSVNSPTSSYKSPNCHSPLPVDPGLRNIPTLPQIMDRYKDERLLTSYQPPNSAYDKGVPLSHLYSKNVHNSIHSGSNSSQMFPSPISMTFNRDPLYLTNIQSNIPTLSNMEPLTQDMEKKKFRKKKNVIEQPTSINVNPSFHSYSSLKAAQSTKSDSSSLSIKPSSIVPGSAFNYGPPGTVGISGRTGLYAEGASFLEELRNSSANPYMTANYLAAAVAVHQRSTPESIEKCSKSDHQQTVHPSADPYRFLTHPQVRPGYPFIGMEPSSPLYQQYLQRQQEELYRHPTSQMMNIFPSGYPGALGVRQPFESLNRPPW